MEGPTQKQNRDSGDTNGSVTVAASLTGDRHRAPHDQSGSHLKAVETPAPAIPDSGEGAYLPAALMNRMAAVYYADRDDNFLYRNDAFNDIAQNAFPEFRSRERREQPHTPVPNELSQIFDRLNAGEREVNIRQSVEMGSELRHFRSTHFRVFEEGKPTGYGGLYTDVTLEAEAVMHSARTESRFQDVIRSASDWVWETDERLNLIYVSNRISEALETPPSAVVGRHIFSLGEFEETPSRPDLAASLMPFRGRIFLMPDKRGQTRRISMTGVAVFDNQSGAFVGYRGTGTDVTRQHEVEAHAFKTQQVLEESLTELRERNMELDRALGDARAAAKAKTDFLGKMSHELRTPLNAIIGFAEMSIQQSFGALNSRYLSYFRDIHGAAYHLLNIINDILDTVNIDSATVAVSARPTRLSEVISQAKSIIAVRAEQRNVDIDAVNVSDVWTVLADPGRIRQILVNLLNNAIKFTESGGSVGIDVRLSDTNEVEFTVWDTGVGIPPEEHNQIFESFHQVNSDILSAPSQGTGLGLTISKQLAQLMGGDISVESRPGHGARFTVRLPRAEASVTGNEQTTL